MDEKLKINKNKLMSKTNTNLKIIIASLASAAIGHAYQRVIDLPEKIRTDKLTSEGMSVLNENRDTVRKSWKSLQETITNNQIETTRQFNELKDKIEAFNKGAESNPEVQETINTAKGISENILDELKKLDSINFEKVQPVDLKKIEVCMSNVKDGVLKLKDTLDKLSSSDGDSFVSNFNIIYDYLNHLTIYQEILLIQVLLFILLFLSIFNIIGALFGNEVIRIFNLENRFPSLAQLFRIRAKLQKYYLVWTIIFMSIICLGGILLNLFFIYNI